MFQGREKTRWRRLTRQDGSQAGQSGEGWGGWKQGDPSLCGQKRVHRRGARVQGRREQVPGRGTPRGGEVSGHLTVTPTRETIDIIQKEGTQDLT